MSVSSAHSAVVSLVDTADNSAQATAGARLGAGSYLVEVATAAPRSGDGDSFTLTITVAAASQVTVTGLAADTAIPPLGATTATVSSGFAVTPGDATCTPNPQGATIAPQSGAARTVSYDVPQGTTASVTVTCTSGTRSATATAQFTAAARVLVSGLDDKAETPAVGEASVTVADRITVFPIEAACSATPAGATVTSATSVPGTVRWVTLDVAADTTARVEVTCTHSGASGTAAAVFAANAAPDADVCDDPLGTLAGAGAARTGTLGSDAGCRSLGRYGSAGSLRHYARRHTFAMSAAGWVTIDLETTGSGGDRIDAYVVLMNGSDPDGGTVLERDDDSGAGLDSRIVRRFLQPGRYTIEATTYGPRDHGTYRVTVAADYRTRITGSAAQAEMRVRNGDTVTRRWAYEPAGARLAITSVTPTDGIDARVTADQGNAALTATPTKVGTYDVYVAHSNGGTTSSLHTQITSYCPDDQIELPADCVGPLARIQNFQHDGSTIPQPTGYGPPDGTNSCMYSQVSDDSVEHYCRRVRQSRTYISQTGIRIDRVSEPIIAGDGTDYGRIIRLATPEGPGIEPIVLLEGCQAIDTRYWQCEYRSDRIWQRTYEAGATYVDYIFPQYFEDALNSYIQTVPCTIDLFAVFVSIAQSRGATVDPQAAASVVESCGGIAAAS